MTRYGYVHPDFAPLVRVFHTCLPARGAGGAALTVYHRGERVAHLAGGTVDESGTPFTPDHLALSASTTKGVTAALLAAHVHRGVVDLDRPVAHYWPEFAAEGKGRLTVAQLAAHQAGLYHVRALVPEIATLYDWDETCARLAAATPRHTPGGDFGYHAWTHGFLVGEVLCRATGATYSELLEDTLAKPLGTNGLYVGVPDAEMGRVAPMAGARSLPEVPPVLARAATVALQGARSVLRANADPVEATLSLFPNDLPGFDVNDRAFLAASIPAVNGCFSADGLARLYRVLGAGGSHDGVTLASPRVMARMTADQNGFIGKVIPVPLRLKMGFHRPVTLGARVHVLGRERDLGIASADAFGHYGFGGSGGWADPSRELAVGLVTSTFFGRVPLDIRTAFVSTAAAALADRRPRAGARARRERTARASQPAA